MITLTSTDIPGGTRALDRRRHQRRAPQVGESLSRLRLRTGREVDAIDISNAGVLVEGPLRLLPNTHLDIHIVTHTGRVLVRCRVIRAFVCHLRSDLVVYRAALMFEAAVDTSAGYVVPHGFSSLLAGKGTPYPEEAGHAIDGGGTVAQSAERVR